MNIEVNEDGAVLKDGEQVGTINEAGEFVPKDGLHHKTAASVEKELAKLVEGAKVPPTPEHLTPPANVEIGDDPEPLPADDRGDISRNVVEWRKAHWPADKFDALYPPLRLQAAGLGDIV